MPWSNINVDMRRFGAVCCRWHVAVFAVLFACSLMSLFCLDPKLVSTCVILAPSTVDSFMWARRYSAAMLLFFRHVTWVSLIPAPVCPWIARVPGCLCPCARVPVCPWIPRVSVCPCARGFLVCPCARKPVRRPISYPGKRRQLVFIKLLSLARIYASRNSRCHRASVAVASDAAWALHST